ncbi:unnamed protein product [Discula destructiva]
MFRLRRYRVFVACAVVFVFLLYRVSINSAWDDDIQSQYRYVAGAVLPNAAPKPDDQNPIHDSASSDETAQKEQVKIPDLKEDSADQDDSALTPPTVVQVPDRAPGTVQDVLPYADENEPLVIQKPPGRVDQSPDVDAPIHWTKLPERFPIDKASMIPVPTGKPKSMPTIQHKFGSETAEAKAQREERLAEVKSEMERAWGSYSKYAFGHDELVPIQQSARDPFGGWGATLVDSLDTLWIMGMKQEFDHAYRGVSNIDFTTCIRNDIPVFETTIRYLGGLIAAYDLTGGQKGEYPLLLTKAIELAEVLMGVFDTPNRMPVLYYNWKPAFASQPHRASTRAGVAELGTLSMEFTRLAQLTGEDKYYDAVARITNALEEWQNRDDDTAPLLAGIFPQDIDASGCNKTATNLLLADGQSSLAKEQASGSTPGEPKGYVGKKSSTAAVIVDDSQSLAAGPSKVDQLGIESGTQPHGRSGPGSKVSSTKRALDTRDQEPLAANGLPANWECVAKNLTATIGVQQYGMGGSQDSAYEYFPKQYLLLGGLEPKYQTLHENTVEAVKKNLLFRPMAEEDPDILFSAKARVTADQDVGLSQNIKREYEVTHLTCFLGGMFAMGAKIFESEEDLDIGRRLTDGCVWAYSSMPSGIMAEYALVVPCQSMESCTWKESEWYLGIDSDPHMREVQMKNYVERLAEWEDKKQKLLRAEAERLQAEEELGQSFSSVDETAPQSHPVAYAGASHNRDSDLKRDDEPQSPQVRRKRTLDPETGDTLAFDPTTLDQNAIEEKVKLLEEAFEHPVFPPPPDASFGGTAGQVPIDQTEATQLTISPALAAKLSNKPQKPPTHEEYVTKRIDDESLPPGYTKIGSAGYQLRPEAIESVWYMYRITGDTTWQDKGWKMWKSVMANVKTDSSHSAINGVNRPTGVELLDQMESFWLAETLKYFYLLYAEPDVISLDDWVLNTEAHPFKRPS